MADDESLLHDKRGKYYGSSVFDYFLDLEQHIHHYTIEKVSDKSCKCLAKNAFFCFFIAKWPIKAK